MNRKVLIFGCFLGVVICWYLAYRHKPTREEGLGSARREVAALPSRPNDRPANGRSPEGNEPALQLAASQPLNLEAGSVEQQFHETTRAIREGLIRPIAFYGKAVDEEGQPVPGVKITFEWNNPSTLADQNIRVVYSDNLGLFSLEDVSGINLGLRLEKPGYYISRRSAFSYVYAPELDANFHVPDRTKPVVFRLRQKGAGADLITSHYGVSADLTVKPPKDGTPVTVDLFKRAVDAQGQLEISQIKPEYVLWRQAEEWGVRIAVPNGGLVEDNDEFPFFAPMSGYSPALEFVFSKGGTNWALDLRKQFYIAFGSPRRYGRLTLETSIESASLRLNYAINPDGSRNLEAKETGSSDSSPYLEPREAPRPARQLPPGVREVIPDYVK